MFTGITKNAYFTVIWFITMAFQIVGVQTFGSALSCAPGGLNGRQWMICVGFGVGNLLWQQVINMIHYFSKEVTPGSHGAADEAGILKFGTGRIVEQRSISDSRTSGGNTSVRIGSTRAGSMRGSVRSKQF